jgi:lantibiotic modifying enzyme
MSTDGVSPADRWYAALSLGERAARLAAGGNRPGEPADPALAARRLARWQAQPPFDDPGRLARRLTLAGLSERDFATILGTPPGQLGAPDAEPPRWLLVLQEALAAPDGAESGAAAGAPADDGFLALARPLRDRARARLQQRADQLAAAGAPFDPRTVVTLLEGDLGDRICAVMLERVVALELNVARLEGRLPGATPGERFRHFVAGLHHPATRAALLTTYPVLARRLAERYESWAAASSELLEQLASDWPQLCATFDLPADARLAAIEGEGGDAHGGGRSVRILRFGADRRLVYKPRSLAVDVHFQELLGWLDRAGVIPPLRRLRVLDRGGHGWMEFVAAGPCDSPAGLARFHQRQGGLLALLYLLQATDFHQENLIAAGEQPVLVDLESLFHPDLRPAPRDDAEAAARDRLSHSVLRVGLLPQRVFAADDYPGMQMGGLGSTAGQLSPEKVPLREDDGTDRMRIVRRRLPLPEDHNRPWLAGAAASASVLDHADDLLAGFRAVYLHLLGQRAALAAPGGLLGRFADDEIRVIVRPTLIYGALLYESFHPDLLGDGLDQARFADRLWLGAEEGGLPAPLVAAEQASLERLDIPRFRTRPRSRTLQADGCSVPEAIARTGLFLARQRAGALSQADLERQIWIIEASLATMAEPATRRPLRPRARPGAAGRERSITLATLARPPSSIAPATPDRPPPAPTSAELIACAAELGDRLAALAFQRPDVGPARSAGARRSGSGSGCDDGEEVAWIGVGPVSTDQLALRPLDVSLYDGLLGHALFLAQLGRLTGQPRHTGLARRTVRTVCRRLERDRRALRQVGAFSGWGGVVHGLAYLGELWRDPHLLAAAHAAVWKLRALIDDDQHFDVVGGCAGAILALVPLQRRHPSPQVLDTLRACGQRLLAAARPAGPGLGWTPLGWEGPLAGFSHGAAGIALALLELAALLPAGPEPLRLRALAARALAFERTLFDPAARNWRLVARTGSPTDTPDDFMTAWCHGAPGIALARLLCAPHLDDPALTDEIAAALTTTVAGGFGRGHALCHGDLGNLDVLLHAAARLPDPLWPRAVHHLTARVFAQLRASGPLCGNARTVETPGFLTGLAGIGYGLLRLAAPQQVPSVLALQLPGGLDGVREEG